MGKGKGEGASLCKDFCGRMRGAVVCLGGIRASFVVSSSPNSSVGSFFQVNKNFNTELPSLSLLKVEDRCIFNGFWLTFDPFSSFEAQAPIFWAVEGYNHVLQLINNTTVY